MDIAALSMSMNQIGLMNQVGTAVLSKSLDSMETMGDGMRKIMEASVTPQLGQNVDYSIQSAGSTKAGLPVFVNFCAEFALVFVKNDLDFLVYPNRYTILTKYKSCIQSICIWLFSKK